MIGTGVNLFRAIFSPRQGFTNIIPGPVFGGQVTDLLDFASIC